jgi:membrane protease subunit HflK
LLAEYKKAPQVTRDRLYTETMQEVYSNVTKVLVDSRQGSNLLYLPLDKIMQSAGAAPQAVTDAAARAQSQNAVTVVPATPADSRARDARSRERESR